MILSKDLSYNFFVATDVDIFMIKSLSLIFLYLITGEIITESLHIPIPGSVIGMIMLTVSLHFKILKEKDLAPAGRLLVDNLAFLFVPAGVGIMLYFDLIQKELIPILASFVVSTLLVYAVVGIMTQKLEKK